MKPPKRHFCPPEEWMPGRKLADTGEYRIRAKIAEGKGTILFRGEHRRSHYPVVVKMVRRSHLSHRPTIVQMATEERILKQIVHPYIIRLHAYHRRAPYPFLVVEYVNGQNLKQWVVSRNRDDFETPVKVMTRMAEALAAVHRHGFIHRDVKPDNMLVTEAADVRLIDFALCRPVRRTFRDLFRPRHQVQGTRSYMSPEQIRGERLDERSDIYSFGCALYEVISGRPPFTSVDNNLLLKKHLTERPRTLSNQILDMNLTLESLTMEMLEKRPDDRPQSMEYVAAVLKDLKSIKADAQA